MPPTVTNTAVSPTIPTRLSRQRLLTQMSRRPNTPVPPTDTPGSPKATDTPVPPTDTPTNTRTRQRRRDSARAADGHACTANPNEHARTTDGYTRTAHGYACAAHKHARTTAPAATPEPPTATSTPEASTDTPTVTPTDTPRSKEDI